MYLIIYRVNKKYVLERPELGSLSECESEDIYHSQSGIFYMIIQEVDGWEYCLIRNDYLLLIGLKYS